MVRSAKTTFKKLPVAVALDSNWKESKVWLKRLKGRVWGFKIGSILFSEKGPQIIDEVRSAGFKVFLDLKFCDIPNTVSGAVKESFGWGVNLLTVHASGGRAMLEAAAKLQKAQQLVAAVTVLTSMDQTDLTDIGVSRLLQDQVSALGRLSIEAGIRGLVCSPHEVARLRSQFPQAFLVTPGVRLREAHDQKRVATLREAIENGSSLVVLGRALTEAKDWESTWQELISSLDGMSLKKLSA